MAGRRSGACPWERQHGLRTCTCASKFLLGPTYPAACLRLSCTQPAAHRSQTLGRQELQQCVCLCISQACTVPRTPTVLCSLAASESSSRVSYSRCVSFWKASRTLLNCGAANRLSQARCQFMAACKNVEMQYRKRSSHTCSSRRRVVCSSWSPSAKATKDAGEARHCGGFLAFSFSTVQVAHRCLMPSDRPTRQRELQLCARGKVPRSSTTRGVCTP